MGITLPTDLPTSLTYNNVSGISLPFTLPMSFNSSKKGITLPLILPMTFSSIKEKRITSLIPYKETVNLKQYKETSLVPYYESASGQISKIPFKEKAWHFPGLIISENVITEVSQQLNIVENVQALILVNFGLLSTNRLRLTWYGNTVPSFTVMKKSATDEKYSSDGTYDWGETEAIVDIESEDYNVYLQGTSNSGTSAVYTIGGANDVLVEPTVNVALNRKIYTLDIDYTSIYTLDIDY